MANLRLLYDNAADRSTISTTQTAGALAASNLLNDFKSQVWRSTTTSAQVNLVFNANETLSCVVFPFSNLTPSATMRVQLYSDTGVVTQILDTGAVACCGQGSVGTLDFNQMPTGANGYSYGGGSYACVWFTQTANVRHAAITITDTSNTQGYVEAARVVIGKYWTPAVNADFGAQLSMVDMSKHSRNDGGDLVTVRASRHKKLTFTMSNLLTAERLQVISVLRNNGMYKPLYCSLMPVVNDLDLEQSYQIYGRLAQISAISTPYFATYASSIDIEEL